MSFAPVISTSPLAGLATLSLDDLKRLVVELLAWVSARENRFLCGENARLKGLPKRPEPAPDGMD